MNELGDRWLSPEEIAEYLGVKRNTLYKWIDRNSIPAHKVGRLWRFRREEIDEWVKSGKADSATSGGKRSQADANRKSKGKQ